MYERVPFHNVLACTLEVKHVVTHRQKCTNTHIYIFMHFLMCSILKCVVGQRVQESLDLWNETV